MDVHVPADAAPARVDRPRSTVLVEDVCDVRVSVDEEGTFLTQSLRLEHHVELAELCEALGLRAKGDHDLGIVDATHERVHCELTGRNVFFDVAEKLRYALVNVAELHLGVVLGEALLGDELSACVSRRYARTAGRVPQSSDCARRAPARRTGSA